MLYLAAFIIGGLLVCWYYERQLDAQALDHAEQTLRDLGVATDRIGLGEPKPTHDDGDVPLPFEMPFNIRDYVPPKHVQRVHPLGVTHLDDTAYAREWDRQFATSEIEAWN